VDQAVADVGAANRQQNKLRVTDRAVHDWYRFVLSIPPHLVREYLDRFHAGRSSRVLDPFCGTGTVLVEAKKQGYASVGIEANPLAKFASAVKTDWTPDPDGLRAHGRQCLGQANELLEAQGFPDVAFGPMGGEPRQALRTLPAEAESLLLTGSISQLPLHKTLVLLDILNRHADTRYLRHEALALAKALVTDIGNLHFGPEVGIGKPKRDAPVLSIWMSLVNAMAADLDEIDGARDVSADVYCGDAREASRLIEEQSVDIVITSPPYPNEKDYTRTTRLESVILGFIENKEQLRQLKQGLVRSNTRSVYKVDDDDAWVSEHAEIQDIARRIEARRIEMGKTSGFERLYHRVTKLYFGGMARHLADLRTVLRPGARLAYVVGDQASYLRVMIRTGQLLAEIADSLGYRVVDVELFRTRLATATREQLREEVVVLEWPGPS